MAISPSALPHAQQDAAADATAQQKPHVVIIGGGVIGITTAISLLDHPVAPYNVTLLAPDLPSFDASHYGPSPENGVTPFQPSYASAWAGAHHVSSAKTDVEHRRDQETFKVMVKLEQLLDSHRWPQSKTVKPLVYVHQTEYWSNLAELDEECVSWYPQYKKFTQQGLPDNIDFAATFKTLDINVPTYLPMLWALFFQLGGRAIQHRATSIQNALDVVASPAQYPVLSAVGANEARSSSSSSGSFGKASLVVASPGLGAKELLKDQDVMPTRGQTVLVRAPWCTTENVHGAQAAQETQTECCGMSRWTSAHGNHRDTYIIPRGDGTIICGGTRIDGDWDIEPRPETTKDIIRRVLQLMPSLKRPDATADDDVDIVDVNVGLRPNRKGGVRLHLADEGDSVNDSDVPLLYCYGFGGIGYQSSWGAAFEARRFVDEKLGNRLAQDHETIKALDSDSLRLPDPATFTLASSTKKAVVSA